MAEVSIRTMRPADVDAALDMFAAVAAEGRWLGTEAGFDRDVRREAWLAGLDDPRALSLVVESDGRLLGNGHVRVARYGVGELGMALAADIRGQGVGGRLLDALVAGAAARGAHKVDLQVWPHNEAAIRLYLSRGFVVEGRLRAHYRRVSGQAWDSLIMGRVLDPTVVGSGLADAPSLSATPDR